VVPALNSIHAIFLHSRKILYLGVATAVLAVVAVATVGTVHLRREAESRTAATTQNLAQSLELTIDGIIDTIDVVLLVSADEIGKQTSAAKVDTLAVGRLLERQHAYLEGASYLRVTDERGEVVYGSGARAGSQKIDIADRDFFIRLRDDPATELVVASPVIGRSTGKWVWPFARRYHKRDGTFGGIVVAAIFVDGISTKLAAIKLRAGDSVTLRDSGLGLIARHPRSTAEPVRVGDQRLSVPFRESLGRNRDEGTYISGETTVDGVSRIHSYRRNAKYGYTVNAGVATANAYRAWRTQAAGIAGLTLAFVIGALAFARLIGRAWRAQGTALEMLGASRQSLQEAHVIANLGTYLYDLRGDTWTSSEVLDGIFGIGPNYCRDSGHWLALVEPNSRQEMQAHLNAVIEQRLPFDHEYGIVRPADGQRRWVHGKGLLEFDAQGTPVKLRGTIQDITDTHNIKEALLERQAELQNIYKSLQTIREEERHRLARELHDDLGHRVTALRMDLDWLDSRLTAVPPAMMSKMAGITQQIDELADSIRRITEDMRPGMLDSLGLIPALQDCTDKFSARTGIRCELTATPHEIAVDDAIGISIYRIVQEALNNVLKHATATVVAIDLCHDGAAIVLTIVDDGVGMADVGAGERKGFGLAGMRERVGILNGELALTSQPGRGVRIQVSIPTSTR